MSSLEICYLCFGWLWDLGVSFQWFGYIHLYLNCIIRTVILDIEILCLCWLSIFITVLVLLDGIVWVLCVLLGLLWVIHMSCSYYYNVLHMSYQRFHFICVPRELLLQECYTTCQLVYHQSGYNTLWQDLELKFVVRTQYTV